MFTKKFSLKSCLSIVFLSAAASFGVQQSIQAQSTKDITLSEVTSSEAFLHQVAEMMNQRLPMMVDDDTRWDASFAGPGKSLSYNYTLMNYSAANIDGYVFAKNAHAMLTESVCNDPSTVIFPQEGVLLGFNYYDNARNLIARVKVQPSDCGY